MSRSLCDAVLRAQFRRLRTAATRRPLALALVALAWLAAPVAAWRLGASVAQPLAPVLAERSSARALVLGLGLTCSALGATVGVSLPATAALGAQIVAAPVPRRALALAIALPVTAAVFALVGPILSALLASFAAAAPGGNAAPPVLLGSLTAATAMGALLAEAVSWLVAGRFAATALAGAVFSLATGALAIEAGARALTGGSAAVPLGLAAAAAAVGCAYLWLGLVAARPPRVRCHRGRPLLAPRGRPSAAVVASGLALLSRSDELRPALLAAVGFGLAGLAVGALTGAPPEAGVLLGGGSCGVAACLVPLSVRGKIDPGVWVWRTAGRIRTGTAWAAASLGLVVAVVLPVCLVALARTPPAAPAVVQVVGLAVFAWASALLAGAVVPRRARGAGDDALSLATLAAVAVVLGAATGAAASRLDTAGVPRAAAGGFVLGMVCAGATVVLASTWGRR